jgi:hypothetical protein
MALYKDANINAPTEKHISRSTGQVFMQYGHYVLRQLGTSAEQ